MAKKQKSKSKKKQSPLPLILIGIGLIVVAGIFMVFNGSKPPAASASNANGNESALSSSDPAASSNSQEFPPAPELTLTDLDGNQVSLSDYRGHWLLVNNWATWCPPCRAEMPELNEYYMAHKDSGFVLIGISAGDPANDVKSFVLAYDLQFPIWLDPYQDSVRAFRRTSLPNSFIIDPDGYIRMSWSGGVTLEALEKNVTPLISGE
ncbi:MAG TPA: TlpA family protein disulfide reductase [Anaerolineales bacterium]|nr:TlpA family protein disulfide reductase [Anaerolineales bacterium]